MTDDTRHGLKEEVQEAIASGTFSEKLFQRSVCFVLDDAGVAFEREKKLKPQTADPDRGASLGRRCDIYIPETDTAIELKLQPNLRGVGQCAYYAQYCRETILLVDGDSATPRSGAPAIREALRSVPGAGFGYCIPGVDERPSVISVETDARTQFLDRLAYGSLGERPAAIIKGHRTERAVNEVQYLRGGDA